MREASYLTLSRSGELARRAERAVARLTLCDLCPRRCRVDRARGALGACRTAARARVASAGPHFGEEAPLVGGGGSGAIFFSCCNLRCIFCQNADISRLGSGDEVTAEDLARTMLDLQARGCENINLVSPSHVIAQVLQALVLASEGGLRLPLVYNSGGYDSVDALALLEGVVDIYMPDMKYADRRVGSRLSGVGDYPARNREAVREMHRQVGDLQLDAGGVARRGLLVRHLVLPSGLGGTKAVAEFLARQISRNTYLNLMDQYRSEYQAYRAPEIDRRPTAEELREARDVVRAAGLWRLDGSPEARRVPWPPEGAAAVEDGGLVEGESGGD
jgi:putative pyruvate formate lyase activating enzyme